jgi:putative phage-type endonuclease
MSYYTPDKFNNAKLLGAYESGSQEWHDLRKNSIGGSEVGTILGLNPWESAYYLWASKTGNIPPKELNSFAVTLGNVLEPVIIDELLPMQHDDWEIYRTGTYQHGSYDFMHANPDALAKVDGEWVIVEVKTSRNYWDRVPPAYEAQVMHYMNIMGVKRAVIVGLVAMDWVEHWIEFDQFEADTIEQKVKEFWKLIKTKEEPKFDGSQSTFEAVREMHPEIDGSEIEIQGLHELANTQARFDEIESELRQQKSEVMRAMGNAQHGYVEVDGNKYRVASRRARNGGKPFLVINTKGLA